MQTVAVARNAMATRFEILLHGENSVALRAAGEQALDEIERLEAQLSLYRPTSEISWINSRAAQGPVRVEPELFGLLQHAKRLHVECAGAFDITIAPLVRCWGFMGNTGKMPDPGAVAQARSAVGMQWLTLNEKDFTIRFERYGMMIDLGAIGKGYALERAVEILIEGGVTSALLHGGTSTVYALGAPPQTEAWKVAIDSPRSRIPLPQPDLEESQADRSSAKPLAVVSLRNEALSVSAVHGRSFVEGERTYGHVIDPHTGEPVLGSLLAAVTLPSATESDALSTALLALGTRGHSRIANLRPGMRTLLLTHLEGSDPRLETKGAIEVL
jgi:thiamine biosynthesis lipoprotein